MKYRYWIVCTKTEQVFESGTCVEAQLGNLQYMADDYSHAELITKLIQ